MKEIKISEIEGFKIGSDRDTAGGTGCTVIICRNGATAGVEVRGSAPATRETDLLSPVNKVEKINAVILSGGSAFGLDAAGGVMKYLGENSIDFETGFGVVPIVCGASLFDLCVGNPKARPDMKMGYAACMNARENCPKEGNYGAGTLSFDAYLLDTNDNSFRLLVYVDDVLVTDLREPRVNARLTLDSSRLHTVTWVADRFEDSLGALSQVVALDHVSFTRSLTLAGPSSPVTGGQTFAVSGNYKENDVAREGVPVGIFTMDEMTSVLVGSGTTDGNGDYAATIGPLPVGDHVLQASIGASPDAWSAPSWRAASNVVTVHVGPMSTVTTVKVTPTTITVGEAFVVGGTVTTAAGGAVTGGHVELWLQRPGETSFSDWRSTNPYPLTTGSFSTSFEPDVSLTVGTYKIKAVYGGTANFLASESSEPAILTVTPQDHKADAVTTAEKLQSDLLTGTIPAAAFKNTNNVNAFSNKLNAVIADINAGNYATAMSKLQNDLIPKTDGCALRGTADKTDWITDCGAQGQVYPLLMSMLEDLQQL